MRLRRIDICFLSLSIFSVRWPAIYGFHVIY
jgi:hypothetical protein